MTTEELEQSGPQAACPVVRDLIHDTRENTIQLTWIEIQPFTGWAEIEFCFIDNNGFQMTPFAARALAAAGPELQLVNGIKCSGESTCILLTVKQLV